MGQKLQNKSTFSPKRLAKYTWVVISIWTIIIVAFLLRDLISTNTTTRNLAIKEARAHFKKDEAFRFWSATHGGFYVPITDKTQPNPDLDHMEERDIETPSGRKLTLMNPAYALRQMNEEFAESYGVAGHITSLMPLRPANKADDWELIALELFEEGETEIIEFAKYNGEDAIRLMQPLITQKGCLKCHEHQGYKEGDIRGGVSITIPMTKYFAEQKKYTREHITTYAIMWLIGIGFILRGSRIVAKDKYAKNIAQDELYQANIQLENRIEKRTFELKESEERYKGIIRSTASCIAVYEAVEDGNNFVFVDLNPMAEKIENITKDKVIGKKVTEVFPGVEDFGLLKVFQNVYKSGNPQNFPVSFYKDKRIEGYRDNYIYKLTSGEIVVVYQDVTERKHAENIKNVIYNISNAVNTTKDLKSLILLIQKELSAIIDTTNFYVALYDKSSGRLSLPFIKDKKIDEDIEFIPEGKTLTKYVVDTKKSLLANTKMMAKLEKEGKVDKNGPDTKLWLGIPLKIENEVKGVLALQSYISEDAFKKEDVKILEFVSEQISYSIVKKQQEEALQKQNKELQLLTQAIEQSPACVVITDTRGNIEYVNKYFCELTGFSEEEAMGQNPRILNAKTQNLDHYKKLWKVIKSGKTWIGEFHNKKKNGEFYWENAIISPVTNPTGKITHYIAVKEDITEKKKLWSELKDAKERAEESDRLKTAFLQNISHEIRTPMNGILGFTSLLKNQKLKGDEQQTYVDIITVSGERMLNTINDLMDISMIEAGHTKVIISEVEINSITNNLFKFFKPEVEKAGMKLFVNNELNDEEAIIKTDKEKLIAILTNLIKNAIKYAEKGDIKYGYTKKDDCLEFFVSDTGKGIPKNRQSAIFDRFVQAEVAEVKTTEGQGLGLSISKAHVEMLGGKIWLESEEGAGAKFYFTIPYKSEDGSLIENINKEWTKTTDMKSSKQKPKLKVLIAEDEEVAYEFLSIVMENSSREILKANNGKEAVEICRNNPDIDLILMDIRMPVMTGYEATIEIRKFNKDVKIIAQTAYALHGDRQKVIKAGCNDYISKPINIDELMMKIEKLI